MADGGELGRQLAQAREDAALARWKALAGNPAAYKARLSATEALRRDEGWDPIERVSEEERRIVANG